LLRRRETVGKIPHGIPDQRTISPSFDSPIGFHQAGAESSPSVLLAALPKLLI
jgi:hypothetical protein